MTILHLLGALSMAFVAIFTWCSYTGPQNSGGQSRRASIIEAWANLIVGFSVNFCANFGLLPLVGAHVTPAQNLFLGFIYTAISIVRQYALRRWFNDRIHLFAARAAERLS